MRRRDFIGLLGAITAYPRTALSETRSRPLIGRLGFPQKTLIFL